MKLDPLVQRVYDERQSRVRPFEGDGYSVFIVQPSFIRYVDPEGVVTMPCELMVKSRTGSPAKRMSLLRALFMRSWWEVFVESPLQWDNSDAPLPPKKRSEIIRRVEAALKKRGGTYKIVSPDGAQQA
jgi:hypothetical protein